MFKNIIDFWKGKDFLTEVLKDFEKMLADARSMYVLANQEIVEAGSGGPDIKDRIYEIDRAVNEAERQIRKRVLEHLAFQPTVDLPVSLVLISVVKDAERLGDYAKNLFEISELLKKPFGKDLFQELFDGMDKKLLIIFDKTKHSFIHSDQKVADEIMDLEREIIRGCDTGIAKLASGQLETNLAVATTLVFRYYKRIGAHLGNIATSVIMPVTDLDYFDEKKRREKI